MHRKPIHGFSPHSANKGLMIWKRGAKKEKRLTGNRRAFAVHPMEWLLPNPRSLVSIQVLWVQSRSHLDKVKQKLGFLLCGKSLWFNPLFSLKLGWKGNVCYWTEASEVSMRHFWSEGNRLTHFELKGFAAFCWAALKHSLNSGLDFPLCGAVSHHSWRFVMSSGRILQKLPGITEQGNSPWFFIHRSNF